MIKWIVEGEWVDKGIKWLCPVNWKIVGSDRVIGTKREADESAFLMNRQYPLNVYTPLPVWVKKED